MKPWFKGKTDSGSWTEGFFAEDDINSYIIQKHNGELKWIVIQDYSERQFTGYFDKNGEKVFIGDVVKCMLGNYVVTMTSCCNVELHSDSEKMITGNAVKLIDQMEIIGNEVDDPHLIDELFNNVFKGSKE